jgi:hypothetical protein
MYVCSTFPVTFPDSRNSNQNSTEVSDMSMPRILQGAAIVTALSISLAAQQEPVGYHHIQCVKVNPGQQAATQEWIAG